MGLHREVTASREFHAEGLPLLVSSQLLRSRDMGQIDLSRLRKDREGWIIEVKEVKSSVIGEEMLLRGQRSRLFSAVKFLAGIFGFRAKFVLSSSEDHA